MTTYTSDEIESIDYFIIHEDGSSKLVFKGPGDQLIEININATGVQNIPLRFTDDVPATYIVVDDSVTDLPLGTIVKIYVAGSGGLTIKTGSDLVFVHNNKRALIQYEEVTLRKDGPNEWVLGFISPPLSEQKWKVTLLDFSGDFPGPGVNDYSYDESRRYLVSVTGHPNQQVDVAVKYPTGDPLRLVTFWSGGGGHPWWGNDAESELFIDDQVVAYGDIAAQIKWATQWGWLNATDGVQSGPDVRAAFVAALMRQLYKDLAVPYDIPHLPVGQSGGSAAIAFAVYHYDCDDVVQDGPLMSAGPPYCTQLQGVRGDGGAFPDGYAYSGAHLDAIDAPWGYYTLDGPAQTRNVSKIGGEYTLSDCILGINARLDKPHLTPRALMGELDNSGAYFSQRDGIIALRAANPSMVIPIVETKTQEHGLTTPGYRNLGPLMRSEPIAAYINTVGTTTPNTVLDIPIYNARVFKNALIFTVHYAEVDNTHIVDPLTDDPSWSQLDQFHHVSGGDNVFTVYWKEWKDTDDPLTNIHFEIDTAAAQVGTVLVGWLPGNGDIVWDINYSKVDSGSALTSLDMGPTDTMAYDKELGIALTCLAGNGGGFTSSDNDFLLYPNTPGNRYSIGTKSLNVVDELNNTVGWTSLKRALGRIYTAARV